MAKITIIMINGHAQKLLKCPFRPAITNVIEKTNPRLVNEVRASILVFLF